MDAHLLSIVTFLPLLAALILAVFLRGDDEAAHQNAKWLAMITTVSTFLISLFIIGQFDPNDTDFQLVIETEWIFGLNYRMGVDGISVLFVMLTTFLMPLVVLASWEISHRVKEYMIAFLVLETLMLGAFMALDLILFFLFVEASLIPMFMIIGIWGGAGRIYASFKYLLFTLLGSVLMLVAMLAMYADAGTTCIGACDVSLLRHQFNTEPAPIGAVMIAGGMQTLLFLAFFVSFAVKLPIWPLHTWLPDAQEQAPTAASVVLAAILLKLGGYGLLRFALPMFPVGADIMTPFVMWLSAIAIVYAALVALVQEDMKRLIAYASVAHMGFVTLGIFAGNQQGVDGAIFQMISHGFVACALFLCVGVIYDRIQSREVDAYGGLINAMPAYAVVFMLFIMANVGLPGTSGFVGPFLTLLAVFQVDTWVAVVAASGLIVSAAYALRLYRRVVMGDLMKESLKAITDMSPREKWLFVPLVGMTLLLGVYPALVLDVTGPSVAALVDTYAAAVEAGAAVQTADLGQ